MVPTEGVETREGATTAMFALGRGHMLVLSSRPAGDPLLRRGASALCAAARRDGRAAAGRRPAPTAGSRRSRRCPAAAALRRRAGAPGGPRRRPPGLDGRVLRDRAEPRREHRPLACVGLRQRLLGAVHGLIERLARPGPTSHVAAVYDARSADKRRAAAERLDLDAVADGAGRRGLQHPDVDLVLVLTRMNEHGPLARAALEAGKHVLVEKPVATSLAEAAELVELAAERRPATCCCAPHILLSPTYRAMHARVRGRRDRPAPLGPRPLRLGRARTGRRWFYEPGGGALFDLGVYNVVALCGFFGPARRVTAMTGVAIPERVDRRRADARRGRGQRARADRLRRRAASPSSRPASRCRSTARRAIELYGTHGVLQLLGDDWAPEGYELWRNGHGAWEVHPETDPTWPWTDGLRHLVRVHRDGRRAGDPARARLPRARDHAGRAGGRRATAARATSRATSRRPDYASLRRGRTTTAASTTRGRLL